jgi:hypothetical protein
MPIGEAAIDIYAQASDIDSEWSGNAKAIELPPQRHCQ